MRAKLLEIGYEMLERNCRLYRHQFTFKSKLRKTLNGDASDPKAIESWSVLLGAMVGPFRRNVYFNHETYWNVNRLPLINYYEHEQCIEQQNVLARSTHGCVSKPDFSLNMLNTSDSDDGLVVSTIGQFGHPLIRGYLGEINKYCMTSL